MLRSRLRPGAPNERRRGNLTPIHRAPAGLKLALTLILAVTVALVPREHAAWTALLFVPFALVVHTARLPPLAFLKRVALILPLVLGVAVLSLFQGEGWRVALSLIVKAAVSVSALELLALTTPFQELLGALRRSGLPRMLLHALALLHRYLFIAVAETERLRRARKARTWSASKRAAWQASSSVIATTFVRSTARAERISRAMQARGGP